MGFDGGVGFFFGGVGVFFGASVQLSFILGYVEV